MTPGCEVRTIMVEGEPWFVAADVAKILGYGRAVDMTRYLEDDEKGCPFNTPLAQLPREDRKVIVGDMAQRGMSSRAIAPVVGVNYATVTRDIQSVATATDAPRVVNGIDGVTRTFQPRTGDREARTPPSTKCCRFGIKVIPAAPGHPAPGRDLPGGDSVSEFLKIDLSKAPKDYAAFGRAVWATLAHPKTVALSEGFPSQMAALAVKNGLKASEKATIARAMRVKADQAVALSQGATEAEASAWAGREALGADDDQARAWATRESLGVDGFGSQKQFNDWADGVGL